MQDSTYSKQEIALCSDSDHGKHGKMIHFLCPFTEKWHCQKAGQDHEADMRRADATLLHAIIGDFISKTRCYIGNDLYSPLAQDAFDLLGVCYRALSATGDKGSQFHDLAPFSAAAINVAAGYLLLVLGVLDCSQLHNDTVLKKIYACLKKLADKAEIRYQLVSYQD